jgi:membrane fusion protein (multidrug efflux system)
MKENTDTMVEETKPAPPARDSEDDSGSTAETENGWKRFERRNPRLRLGLLVGGIALLVAGLLVWHYLSSYETTDDAEITGHLNSISPRVGGQVEKLLVRDNQYVDAGTPLVEIDPRDYQVALERAKADYADAVAMASAARVNVPITTINTGSQTSAAQADVDSARSGISAARQQAQAASAQEQAAEANNVKAQSDLARYKELVEKQEISQQQFDQAVAAARANAAAVDGAKASVSAAEQQVKQAQSRLAQAEANLRSTASGPQQVEAMHSRAQSADAQAQMKKAALDQAQLNLGYTVIVAPVSGVISNRTVEVGQNVQPAQELMQVINLDDIWVTANFKENQLRNMKVGEPVTIHVDTTGKDYNGHVQSIAGASGAMFSLLPPENATGNYVKVVQRVPVKITFDPGETQGHELRPGMSVEPKVWLRN